MYTLETAKEHEGIYSQGQEPLRASLGVQSSEGDLFQPPAFSAGSGQLLPKGLENDLLCFPKSHVFAPYARTTDRIDFKVNFQSPDVILERPVSASALKLGKKPFGSLVILVFMWKAWDPDNELCSLDLDSKVRRKAERPLLC